MPTSIWIIAGEASGDAYGAFLARALWRLDPELTIRGMGGAAMADAGVEVMVDSSELGVVGLVEVLTHLRTFFRIFYGLLRRAKQERPSTVVLIDFPGFNLRFARRLHRLGIRVVYYVSPQVWAWGSRRIPLIARIVDKMLVIFPFESDTYDGTGLDVEFVGHPLLEILDEHREPGVERDANTVLLLPGSRRAEVDRLLPVMLETASLLAQRHEGLEFVVAVPSGRIAERVRGKLEGFGDSRTEALAVRVEEGRTRYWLQRAVAGLAASGTVTVESAILGLPLVVVYKLHALTYHLVRLLVRVPYFTMVNLVAGKMVFEEFLQAAVTPDNLVRALTDILPRGTRRVEAEDGMRAAVQALGGHSHVCQRAAQAVLNVAAAAECSACDEPVGDAG